MNELNFDSLSQERQQTVVGTLMRNVYLWMTLALSITGLTAAVVARSPQMIAALFSTSWGVWVLFAIEIGLVIYLTARIDKMSFSTATMLFILYSLVNGVVFSSIFVVFKLSSIATTFFITAGMFGGMALWGSITKKDLSGIGKFALMALIGLIIAGLVNMFLHNTFFDLIVSGLGVLIFAGLTAYDSQKIRQMLMMQNEVSESTQKIALLGSLSLYLDFINLFLYLLRFFGRGRD